MTISPYNGGFNVYSESGELLLEFLPQDSAEVATLEYIHGATIDFQANPDHWRDPQPDSLPETNPNARNIKHLSSVNNKTFSPKVVSLKNEIRNSYKDVWQK